MSDFPFDHLESVAARVEAGTATIFDYRLIIDAMEATLKRQAATLNKQAAMIDKLENRLLAELEVSTAFSIMILNGEKTFRQQANC